TVDDSTLEGLHGVRPLKNFLALTDCEPTNGSFLKALTDCPANKIIFVNVPNLSDEAFRYLGQMKKLRWVDVRECAAFTGEGWSFLKESVVKKVTWLPVARKNRVALLPTVEVPLNHSTDSSGVKTYPAKSVDALLSIPSLKQLSLNSDALGDGGLAQLSHIKKLQNLILTGVQPLSASGFSSISRIAMLHRLDLNGPILSSQLSSLRKSQTLSEVCLSATGLDQASMKEISRLELTSLYLDEPELPRNAIACLADMKSLQALLIRRHPGDNFGSIVVALANRLPNCRVEEAAQPPP
ncbi:MAG: hypothetical protein K2Z81_22420, partial [Cyanobacteria bacterium]|nr:hypothetical protein [Cyanobacteriota bacterium]